ncbi:retropepsin-like aspartic protease [Sphingomonas sp. MMS24-JH45]
MERIGALLLACLLAAPPAAAQVVASTMTPADDDLAFTVLDQRMSVPVTIGGAGGSADAYPFIVDTGAQRSVVSRQLARRLGLPVGRRVRVMAMSGSSDVETVIIPSLRIATAASGSRHPRWRRSTSARRECSGSTRSRATPSSSTSIVRR